MKTSMCRQKIRGSIIVALLAAFVAAVPTGASAANKLIVQDNSAVPVDKFVVTDTGSVGIGTNAPNYPLTIKGITTTFSSILLGYEGNASYNRYADAELKFARNNINDVAQNNGLAFNGDRLGYFSFGTFVNGVYVQSGGMLAEAAENHTATSHAGNVFFMTTAPNQLYPESRLSVLSTGFVGVGTIAPSQRLEVNGGVRLNNTSMPKPVCSVNVRGTLWFTAGAADTLEVCAKDASNNYAWRALF